MMTKLRSIADIGQLFFITDDNKLKGNRAYDNGKYYEALDAYEQVLGCFLWLSPKSLDQAAFEELTFQNFDFNGITDDDFELKEK